MEKDKETPNDTPDYYGGIKLTASKAAKYAAQEFLNVSGNTQNAGILCEIAQMWFAYNIMTCEWRQL